MNRIRVGLSVVAVALWAAGSQSAYLESDSGAGERLAPRTEPSVRILPRPAHEGNPLARLAALLEVGSPFSYRGLTLFPLYRRPSAGLPAIATLDEAVRRNRLTVREKGAGEVPFLHVRNDGSDPVLLMAGELVLGGRQNRLVRDDVLLPPRSDFVEVSVYCGEQGRWTGDAAAPFKSAGSLAAPGLRSMAAQGESQDRIWREIDGHLERAAAASPTRSYQALFDDRERQRRLDDYAASLRRSCANGAVGCVVVARGRIRGCELFGDAELYSRLFDKICRSYATELVFDRGFRDGDREADARHWAPESAERDVRRFLDWVQEARSVPRGTPGLGENLIVSGSVSGSALVWRGEVVHAALFTDGAWPPPPPRLGPRPPEDVRPAPRPFWK